MGAKTALNNLMPVPYISVKDGRIKDVNYSFTDMTGYSRDEVLYRSISEILTRLFRRESNIHGTECDLVGKELYLFTKSSHVRQVSILSNPTPKKNEVIYIIKEKDGIRFEDKFSYIEQLCSDDFYGIAVYSVPELTLLKTNLQYINYIPEPFNSVENAIGHNIGEIAVEWWESDSSKEMWEDVLKTGKSIHLKDYKTYRYNRGEVFWDLTLNPVTEDGRVKYVVVIITDVTDKVLDIKSKETRVQIVNQQKEQLDAVIENMSDAMFILDRDGNFIKLNKAARNLFPGNSLKKIGDRHKLVAYFDRDGKELSVEDMPAYKLLKGEKAAEKKVIFKVNNQERYFDINAIPILGHDGNLTMVVTCCRDVTDSIKYNEMILAQQERLLRSEIEKKEALEKVLEMKDEFLSTVSHEFKTPLTVIYSAVQTMETVCKDEMSDKIKWFISKIRQNTLRQIKLVNNLLDITRINSGHVKVHKRNMDIEAMTRAIVDSVSTYVKQKGIKLEFFSSLKSKIIALDDEKYERILLNLLSNAIKFTPQDKSVYIIISQKKDKVSIAIRDEGIGIPEDKQELIFEHFGQVDSSLTRKVEGTGIGLSLVKLLVNALGGDITLESEYGKGSTFTLTLPWETVPPDEAGTGSDEYTDNRLAQAIDIEFADLYFTE